jgi:hypothetical protein
MNVFDGAWASESHKGLAIIKNSKDSRRLVTVTYENNGKTYRGPFLGVTFQLSEISPPNIEVDFTDDNKNVVLGGIMTSSRDKIYWSNDTVWKREMPV